MCRQVRPLRRHLKTLKAWITGQRKDQSPGTRADIPIVQSDPAFEGVVGGPDSLVKFNPLSNISSEEVWNFLRVMVSSPQCVIRIQKVSLHLDFFYVFKPEAVASLLDAHASSVALITEVRSLVHV